MAVSNNLEPTMYHDQGIPNSESGCLAVTACLIQGLLLNIHGAHQNKYFDSAKHLRHIIESLEDGFVSVVQVNEGERKF
jgi:hypothetical protein